MAFIVFYLSHPQCCQQPLCVQHIIRCNRYSDGMVSLMRSPISTRQWAYSTQYIACTTGDTSLVPEGQLVRVPTGQCGVVPR